MKIALMVLGALVLVAAIAPAFLPARFSMSRAIEINTPVSLVFSKLTDLNEYVKWNPFPEGDPTNTTQVSGVGEGSFLTWTGNKTGEGKMTIARIESDKKIAIKMDFYKPMSAEAMVHWITNPKSETSTEMVWTFDQDLSYFNRYFGLFMEGMMGEHFEKGLAKFKTLAETK